MQWVTPFPKRKNRHLPLFLENVYANTAMSCQGFPIGTSHPQLDGKNTNGWEGLDALWEHAIIPRPTDRYTTLINMFMIVYAHLKLNIAPEKLPYSLQLSSEDVPTKRAKVIHTLRHDTSGSNAGMQRFLWCTQLSLQHLLCCMPGLPNVGGHGPGAPVTNTSTYFHHNHGFLLNHKGWMYYMQHVHTCTE